MHKLFLFGIFLLLSTSNSGSAKTTLKPLERPVTIVINQLGYLPHIQKVALLISEKTPQQGEWQLQHTDTGKIALRGQLANAMVDPQTNFQIQPIDFSFITTPGAYQLRVNHHVSFEFRIANDVYNPLIKSLLRSYYLQRCGQNINDPLTGMKRPPCHLNDGVLANNDTQHERGKRFQATGGWHDAGDYGKYVATTAVVLLELLSRYERYEEHLSTILLDIPESNNALPDMLDELKIALDWMLSMQRQDGAVYRKLSGQHWPATIPPEEDLQKRFVYGVSSHETGKAIAAWALAARIYERHDKALSDRYLAAAKHSWQWLEQQDEVVFDHHDGDDDGSGAYNFTGFTLESGLKWHQDDKFAAAMELFLTTGDASFADYVEKSIASLDLMIMEWKNPSAQSMINALYHPHAQSLSTLRAAITNLLREYVISSYQRSLTSKLGLANHRFMWASNKMTAEEGILLKQAAHYLKNTSYTHAAWNQVHYLLGRNPFNQTFVTGFGTRPVKHVNHIYSKATKSYLPGLHVGGPNADAQAGVAPKNMGPLSYIDSDQSYATNEYAIDYNSALLSLLFDLMYLN